MSSTGYQFPQVNYANVTTPAPTTTPISQFVNEIFALAGELDASMTSAKVFLTGEGDALPPKADQPSPSDLTYRLAAIASLLNNATRNKNRVLQALGL